MDSTAIAIELASRYTQWLVSKFHADIYTSRRFTMQDRNMVAFLYLPNAISDASILGMVNDER